MSLKVVKNLESSIDNSNRELLKTIGKIAADVGVEVYAVGGFVRDFFLKKAVKDIDFVVVGDGIAFAKLVGGRLNSNRVAVYKKFGTAMVGIEDYELEFVGARKESYRGDSRKPAVEPADLMADLARRDFTINAMALSLQKDSFFDLVDPFHGKKDLRARIIRTPLDPEVTFADDPLRIMRAIRFSAQLKFDIEEKTKAAISATADRLKIISQERITDEFIKIISVIKPGKSFFLMDELRVLPQFLPEFSKLKGVDEKDGYAHKDVFSHTLKVLDNISEKTDKTELRLAALFHDIAKPQTKKFVEGKGWSFHGHEELGARMIPRIFKNLRLPRDWQNYVQKLTRLHLRPIALTEEECTDSAYRRLLFQAGGDLEDLLTLCRADITSRNAQRRKKYLQNFEFVIQRLNDVEAKDKMRSFQSPVRGTEIMEICGIQPGRMVGKIKNRIEEAILDGEIENDYEAAKKYLLAIKDEFVTE
ncbi:MAG: HD domain-containing protein [Calditrichaeota bacterium]|nr:MAG: HD domain-containing protein [Calditrichota bacterium]